MISEPLPRVSICLLTYNRARSLPATLDSLLTQSHGDFELIINDDQSLDNTEEVCRAYERRDSRIRYVKNAVNLRYANNQNAALLQATTEYVAIVHDGDIYRPDLIEKWTRALVEQPTAALVFNSLEVMDEDGKVVNVYRHSYGSLIKGTALFDDMIRRPDSPIFGVVMVRKSCVFMVGPFDPRISTLADIDMWLRLLLRYDAAYIAEPLFRVAPREVNHHNTYANWDIRRQHELIYALNSVRRYPGNMIETIRLRRQIAPMIWKMRCTALLVCLRHGRVKAFVDGLVFVFQRLNSTVNATSDSVLDWESASRDLQNLEHDSGLPPNLKTK